MAAKNLQSEPLILLLLLFSCLLAAPSAFQSTPQNIQVYFPILTQPQPQPLPPTSRPAGTTPSRSSNKTVAKAVAATAASSLVLSGLLFLLVFKLKRRSKEETTNLYADDGINNIKNYPGVRKKDEFERVGGIKGVIVDEQGHDVFYWKKLQDYATFEKQILKDYEHESRKSKSDFPVLETPFLRYNSSSSDVWPASDHSRSQSESQNESLSGSFSDVNPLKHVGNREMMKSQRSIESPPPPVQLLSNAVVSPSAPPPRVQLPSNAAVSPFAPPPPPPLLVTVERKNSVPLPPPPETGGLTLLPSPPLPPPPKTRGLTLLSSPPLPPTPDVLETKNNATPPSLSPKTNGLTLSSSSTAAAAAPPPPHPPPVVIERKSSVPPPPMPPKTGGLTLPSRSPASSDDNQVKLMPLHWDKINANVGHSMVWHKLHNGSFRVDDDRMETFFRTMSIDKKTPQQGAHNLASPKVQMKSGPSRVFLLDTRKSQNIAIVVKSLPISRSKIIDCLEKGKGLDTDTLEKLARITLSKAEVQIILEFEGNITRLADAESFLYHILRAVPSAFTRVNIMLFKSNYRSEVTDVKKHLQTLEMACKELKTRGLFVKLLEAILKAGNRMNVGTSRGNAQAFNLNSLLKLSDVKSSDGKTTLLHFVVEEVVRAEGKRCNLNRNHSKGTRTGGLCSVTFTVDYYIKLGLPILGGVSSEFSNVKKAAGIDYDVFSKSCLGLGGHLAEITKTMEEFGGDKGGGFVREMSKFLEEAERDIQVLRDEEGRIMGLVKITNEYYQAGASKNTGTKQFQLFEIIRGFLEMVDKACLDIAIKTQKRRTTGGSPEAGLKMSKSPDRPSMKFPVLPPNFSSASSSSSSSSGSSILSYSDDDT